MRINFLKHLMETGFTECFYCGKMISPANTINGSCPDCVSSDKE